MVRQHRQRKCECGYRWPLWFRICGACGRDLLRYATIIVKEWAEQQSGEMTPPTLGTANDTPDCQGCSQLLAALSTVRSIAENKPTTDRTLVEIQRVARAAIKTAKGDA